MANDATGWMRKIVIAVLKSDVLWGAVELNIRLVLLLRMLIQVSIRFMLILYGCIVKMFLFGCAEWFNKCLFSESSGEPRLSIQERKLQLLHYASNKEPMSDSVQ